VDFCAAPHFAYVDPLGGTEAGDRRTDQARDRQIYQIRGADEEQLVDSGQVRGGRVCSAATVDTE
jgi:hypothetical protein